MTTGKGDAQPSPPLPAAVIGHKFVRQYYSLLDKDPAKLHRLYKAQSVFSHGVEGKGAGAMISAVGPSEIHSEIMALVGPPDRHCCQTEITGVECQESRQGGVLVLVTGYLTLGASGGERRHFAQTLFLDKQTEPYEGYFVLNDILRYLPSQAPSAQLAPQGRPVEEAQLQPTACVTNGGHRHEEEKAADEEDHGEEEKEEEVEVEEQQEETAVAQEVVAEIQLVEAMASPVAEQVELVHEVSWPQVEEKPKSWAAMAGKLRQEGPGKLAPKPKGGFSLPAPKATMPTAEAAVAALAGRGITGLPPPPSSRPSASIGSQVKMWLSRLQTDSVASDIVESLNAALDSSVGTVLEIERKEPAKDWASMTVSSQEAADALVKLSKQRKLQHQGRGLKAELEQEAAAAPAVAPATETPGSGGQGGESGRRDNRRSGKGSGKGSEDASGGSWGAGGGGGAAVEWEPRGPRKGGKGGKGKGGKGGEGAAAGGEGGGKSGGGRKGKGGKDGKGAKE